MKKLEWRIANCGLASLLPSAVRIERPVSAEGEEVRIASESLYVSN